MELNANSVTRLDEAVEPSLPERLKTLLIGKPRDLADKSLFRHVSLIAFLAWVGLGADGLSSSCYGPSEAFHALGEHRYLGVFLALAIIATVSVISACYSHIIEVFPSGGGGYLVASKLLGRRVGVVSGCALLIDYVMTITVSIAAAGDALFGLFGAQWGPWKIWAEAAAILLLIVLNLRGVRESVQVLLPIFLVFLLTHFVLIVGSISLHFAGLGGVVRGVAEEVGQGLAMPGFGLLGMFLLLAKAYSLGAGTYTGIEAVSNSMAVMREPRVATAKRTMVYMAVSLSFTAGGLIIAYLLLGTQRQPGVTMNQSLTATFLEEIGLGRHWLGTLLLWATLLSEGALLFVAAQAGLIGGPRVLANMAQDSWMPHWLANLSERLATQNGILLVGLAALAALLATHGDVSTLLIMYSINVFVTFSLSMIGMCRHWLALRGQDPIWRRRLGLFAVGTVLCVSILTVTVWQKFGEGGWVTVAITGGCVAVCFGIHRYYERVGAKLKVLDETLGRMVTSGEPNTSPPDPSKPTAVILVGDYSGLGIHTMLNVVRFAPDYYKNFVFVSAGVVDSGNFKGSSAIEELRQHTQESVDRYVDLARRLGVPAIGLTAIGMDAVDELEQLCLKAVKQFPKSTVFAGQLVFQKDSWLQRLMHNQTAYSLQRRLQWVGIPIVILPTRVR
ncbi:MAG: APC family permease [Thermoguttaceae bacterium]